MRMTLVCLLTWLSVSTAWSQPALPDDARDAIYNQGPKQEAVGDKVMVSTQLPIVTETALQVLRDGGNAIDAFVTAVFLQNVVDYHQVSLFGAMGGLYYEAATGKYYVFESYSERPLAGRCGEGDPSKVAIGGKVAGLNALAERFGTRQWAAYLDPAIAAAEEGVLVTSFMYANNYNNWETGDLIQQNEEARAFYMPEGHLVSVGHRWKMPKVAETLRHIASEGADHLYTGAWGKKFVEKSREKGYCVSLEDMADFQVRWSDPVRSTYCGYDIVSESPPKKGGVQIAYNLNILENFDLKSLGHYATAAESLEILTRALGRVENDMRYGIADPKAFQIPTQVWLSKDYARFGADFVRQDDGRSQRGFDAAQSSGSAPPSGPDTDRAVRRRAAAGRREQSQRHRRCRRELDHVASHRTRRRAGDLHRRLAGDRERFSRPDGRPRPAGEP